MSPPIRSKDHGEALQNALAGGVLQIVGTDHAVFNSTQKAAGRHDFRLIPNGVNGEILLLVIFAFFSSNQLHFLGD
jgi:dihydropyrimidinase